MTEHRGSTDAVTKIQLPSVIQRATWTAQSTAVGEPAPFEVCTAFVGDGADVTVEVRTKSGKTIGKVPGKIGVDRFRGALTVPSGTTEDIYLEAQLPKHGLKARSGLLKVYPKRSFANVKWDRSEARRGDVVKLLADVSGIPDGFRVLLEIFEHDADGNHDLVAQFESAVNGRKVEADWEYQYVEDTDEIPSKEESEKGYNPPEYFFRVSAGTASADSGLLTFKDYIEIALTAADGSPVANADYVLTLADGSQRKGKLDADGKAVEKDVPPGKVKVEFPNQ